ncbi:extracellular solute-binding protein family 1 [Candidatus Vecturithrix granuli]|uniref:Extracellular solute-binding protein family 1 n=1 Tax=Vecturithrix granuli TaxID=1499967 RepID=A0A081C6E4_VECG1|nr:extracellular solute-binding protein family 1 [Candidatus Vecturithrix granuli]
MKKLVLLALVMFVWTGILLTGANSEAENIILMTAGDSNMLAFQQNLLAPQFTEKNPDIRVIPVHTGPGNAGSQLIYEKLHAESQSNKDTWDVDIAIVHQIFMKWAMDEDLLLPFTNDIATQQYVTSPFAKNSLGVNIEGYAIPMFHSQTAIAYNPEYVKDPPKTFEELVAWVKNNPGKFGYNGVKGGASGVSFVVGWVYWKTGRYEKLAITGPIEQSEIDSWEGAFKDLEDFNQYVTYTAGNVGTLDALNRGEIWMGPVWVDMFFTFMKEGKMNPATRMILPEPGMPGQPMYYVIPKKTAHPDIAKKYIEFATTPEVQGKEIVERFNWYPGIDGSYLEGMVSDEVYKRIYSDVTPEDLQKKGLAFPLADYHTAILESYEKWVKK